MTEVYEIRDPQIARQHVIQGLYLSRSAPLTPERTEIALALAMEVVADGSPLPPIGFLADLAHVAGGALRMPDLTRLEPPPKVDPQVVRKYEDYVLGKLYADISFERAADAVQRFEGRDHMRGLAYIANQMRGRCGYGGPVLSPAVIKGLQKQRASEVLDEAWWDIEEAGPSEDLIQDYDEMISAVRGTGELLGTEDVFELESGTALAEFGQRVALRQVLRTAEDLWRDLPKHKPTPRPKRYSVATNIMEEDHYPIGGFTSISNKGTVESLLRSELAYIDDDVRPDLFDIKFARDELLYYSRDENQFLRRRLTYTFVLHPSLTAARMKDRSLPCQRIILMMSLVYVTIKQLIDWMTEDALVFEILFVGDAGETPLVDERDLIETLLHDEITSGTVLLENVARSDIADRCRDRAQTSLSQTLSISCESCEPTDDLSLAAILRIDAAVPTLIDHDQHVIISDLDGVAAWQAQLSRLLQDWI